MTKPIFSIIIPCYNAITHLEKCINSIKCQTLDSKLYEIIFINDYSNDGTLDYLRLKSQELKSDVSIINNSTNYGPGISRRKGAEIARGEYLCFCDSDDWLSEYALENISCEISQSHAEIVIFDMAYYLNGKIIENKFTAHYIYGDKNSYLINCGESLCNKAIKKTLFLDINIIDIRHGEDLALVPILVLNSVKVTHINSTLYYYYMRRNSASLGNFELDTYKEMILAFKHVKSNVSLKTPFIYNAIEYIGIKTILYASTLIAIKGGNKNCILNNIVSNFENEYKNWEHNFNLSHLGKSKRVYLWCVYHRIWIIARIYTWFHSFILKF